MGRFLLAILLLLVAAGPLRAQQARAPFVVEESGAAFATLQQAVASIGEGSGTILIAPGRYRQCAVQQAGRVAFVASRPGTAVFDGTACEGKAALVLRGRAARVAGLVFQNIRVAAANGAGIRLEAGDLAIGDSLFRNGENGLLAARDHQGTILIERSTFSGLGRCPEDQGCSHAIYNSGEGELIVRRSRFERGTGGHYVKSRGARIEISDSSFDDSAGRGTNYMIDLANGATGTIARNTFVQGADKENYSAFITLAPEGAEHSSAGLSITDNEAGFAPGLNRRAAFVAGWHGETAIVSGNRLDPRIIRFERR